MPEHSFRLAKSIIFRKESYKNILVLIFFIYLTEAFKHFTPSPKENGDYWNSYDSAENYSADNNLLYLLSSDDIYDGQRIYPDGSGLLDSRDKKSQTRCRVKKIQKTHEEIGAEFYPKQYNEYECVPFDGDLLDGNAHNLGTCRVHRGRCAGIQKYHYYMKKKHGEMCWTMEKQIVNAGCNCVPSILSG